MLWVVHLRVMKQKILGLMYILPSTVLDSTNKIIILEMLD